MFGGGLRLQPATPGVQDQGNYRISGTGICDGFAASYGTVVEANANQIFGFGWNLNPLNATKTGNVGLGTKLGGFQNQIGDSGAVNNPVTGAVAIGCSTGALNNHCIAIGQSTNASTFAFGDIREGGNIAIGLNGFAQTLNRTGGSTYGNVAIGKNAQALGDEFSIMLGTGAANGARSICIGYASAAGTRPRAIIIDTDGATATAAGQIQVGNNNHTGPITIGPINLRANIQTQGVNVNDANYVVAASVFRVQYSAITAARAVTLPAANTLPIGTRVAVTDFSGSCSAVNTITITPAGADTISGGSAVMNAAFAFRELETDGASKWIIVAVH